MNKQNIIRYWYMIFSALAVVFCAYAMATYKIGTGYVVLAIVNEICYTLTILHLLFKRGILYRVLILRESIWQNK
jgi:hypothetical protein